MIAGLRTILATSNPSAVDLPHDSWARSKSLNDVRDVIVPGGSSHDRGTSAAGKAWIVHHSGNPIPLNAGHEWLWVKTLVFHIIVGYYHP